MDNPETITKRDLVAAIHQRTQFPRDTVKQMVQAVLDEIVTQLGKGNRMELRDFGVFEIKQRRARRSQNPRTKKLQEVGPRRAVRFKPGRLMKDAVVAGEKGGTVNTLTKRKVQPAADGSDGVELKLARSRRPARTTRPPVDQPSLKLSSTGS